MPPLMLWVRLAEVRSRVHAALSSVSQQELWVRACRGCYNRADMCHTSPCIFQVSSFCHPGGILNQLRVLVTSNENHLKSLSSPWATMNWLLSKTSLLMKLQTSTFCLCRIWHLWGEFDQLFCGKSEHLIPHVTHSYANFCHIVPSFSKQKNPSLLHFSWNSRFSIFLIIHYALLLIFSASVTFHSMFSGNSAGIIWQLNVLWICIVRKSVCCVLYSFS